MNRAISVLAVFTFVAMVFAYVNIFGGFSISRQVASVTAGITSLLPTASMSDEPANAHILPPPIEHTNEDTLRELFNKINARIASTTVVKAAEEDEPSVSTDDWKIFYTKSDFGGAHAYTLRYPDGWVMNDGQARSKTLMHEVDGYIYTLSFYEEPINLSSLGRFSSATTTTFGDTEFIKKFAQQAGTTTLVAYLPNTAPKSFSIALGTVPPSQSSKYVEIYDRILSTLAVEPADYPFTIFNLKANISGPLLTTSTAIAEQQSIVWKVREHEKINNANAAVDLWIEDEDGEHVVTLQAPRRYNAKSYKFTFANDALKFGQKYRSVAIGKVGSRKTNKAYSNWFTVANPKQFTDASLVVSQPSDTSSAFAIEASVHNTLDPKYRYIVYFGDGEYSVLGNGSVKKYWGKWQKVFNADSTVYLMRTTSEALQNNLYGAKTYVEIQQYADEVVSTEILLR